MGILLILTFILTRIPLFRQLLDRKMSVNHIFYFSCLFGLFGILGTYAGVVVEGNTIVSSFWIFPLGSEQAIAHSALVGVMIGGLMGGPFVGIGAGLITGGHLMVIGGFAGLAGGIASLLTGILAGGIARFFSQERVISPVKALFIGMFAPILLMGVILICASPPNQAIQLVDLIGIPMVLTNSISIAIFTTMLRVALREEERTAAYETQRALYIAEAALPHLKQGLTYKTAEAVAHLLTRELKAAAVAITDTERILAHAGIGTMLNVPGEGIKSELSHKAIATGELQVAESHEQIQPYHTALGAAIIVPITQGGRVAGLIKLYFKRSQEIRSVEIVLAQGLGQLISYQLNVAMHEKMTALMKEAELKVLQAQINPHFLFNTLNSIISLIRVDPDMARHVTMQLGTFMRLNLKVTSSQLISIRQEMDLLHAYLEIIKARFEDQFSVVCDMDPDVESIMIPPASIQLLVENSIKHGLRNKMNGGLIRIELRRNKERAEICIEDNGKGVPPDMLVKLGEKPVSSSVGNGIGVYNINQRLISLFGNDARLFIENRVNGGCRFQFSIPCTQAEGMEISDAH
jgi:two-component system, LytTR family, sensor histidine kinase LytS